MIRATGYSCSCEEREAHRRLCRMSDARPNPPLGVQGARAESWLGDHPDDFLRAFRCRRLRRHVPSGRGSLPKTQNGWILILSARERGTGISDIRSAHRIRIFHRIQPRKIRSKTLAMGNGTRVDGRGSNRRRRRRHHLLSDKAILRLEIKSTCPISFDDSEFSE